VTNDKPYARLKFKSRSYLRLGILSDSHGNVGTTTRAVQALQRAGANALIHLGDIEDEAILDALLTKPFLPVHLVFGNVDWPIEPLAHYARILGYHVHHPCGELICGRRRIVFHHGHEPRHRREALADGVDYILEGHTHRATDQPLEGARLINPGALQRAARYSVAVLAPDVGKLEFVPIARG
jgi:uncharacterized protein